MQLWLDLDGVMCDSNDKWFEWIRKELNCSGGCGPKLSDLTHWSWPKEKLGEWVTEWWKTPGIYRDLVSPFPGAVEFCEKFCYKPGFPVNFITSTYPGMEDEKTEWIQKHFGPYVRDIIHEWNKPSILDKDCLLVEDNLDNIWGHVIENGAHAIQFNFMEKHSYAKFNPEVTNHPRVRYATSYEKLYDNVRDLC